MTVSSADLLYDPQVWCYFAILGWSLRGQVRRATRRGLAAACALVGITWFYIFRFTLAYKNGGGANLFDDAYADVLRGPHARSSCQLLTWAYPREHERVRRADRSRAEDHLPRGRGGHEVATLVPICNAGGHALLRDLHALHQRPCHNGQIRS